METEDTPEHMQKEAIEENKDTKHEDEEERESEEQEEEEDGARKDDVDEEIEACSGLALKGIKAFEKRFHGKLSEVQCKYQYLKV